MGSNMPIGIFPPERQISLSPASHLAGAFVRTAAENAREFAAELPHFVSGIRSIFTAQEISSYLDELERTKFLSPPELDEEDSGLDEEDFEDGVLDNPVRGAQELLRFARIREMLQTGV
jgi:hypothetical protein